MSLPARSIAFLCSSGLHVRLFAPVIRCLQAAGHWCPVIVSLDAFYADLHGNVAATVEALGLQVVVEPVSFRHGASPNRWLRGLQTVGAARWTGACQYRALLRRQGVALLVLGNDTGLAELVAIDAARGSRVPTLLVQDGFLSNRFALATAEARQQLQREKRKIAWLGKLFGGRPYGLGGCDVIAAYGAFWADILRAQDGRGTTRIEVVGHPFLTFDEARGATPGEGTVTYFCTNFLRSNLQDEAAHRSQLREVLAIRALLDECGVSASVLRVKLHPVDQRSDYQLLEGRDGIELLQGGELRAVIASSWFCLTNISSVVLDCAAEARPCLMSGLSVAHGLYAALFEALPGLKAADAEALRAWILRLQSPEGMVEVLQAQREGLAPYVSIEPGRSGALRLAQLAAGLAAEGLRVQ